LPALNYTKEQNKMGLFDRFKKKPVEQIIEPVKEKKPRTTKVKEPIKELTEKEKATAAGEPYIQILRMDIDPDNINAGSFEMDWNDKFILNLIRAGYKMRDDDTDNMIADRWFQTICRNIALEVYEQAQADPTNRDLREIKTRDLGNGRTEVS
jgi:hypothetical protein